MDDITRRDRVLFLREAFSPVRVMLYIAIVACWLSLAPWKLTATFCVLAALGIYPAYKASVEKRFRSPRFHQLWDACEDRLKRLRTALRSLRKARVAQLEDLPHTVESVAKALYVALRRADTILHEVTTSEGALGGPRLRAVAPPDDRQAQELYRIADKNIAEYRQHYQALIGGVHRTEAQAAVFTTTLDALRVRVLGYRLTGRQAELSSGEFLEAMTEARMQLDSIDKALDELELTPWPQAIAIVPEARPDDLRTRLEPPAEPPVLPEQTQEERN